MKTSAKNYLDFVEGTYVEPGRDVAGKKHGMTEVEILREQIRQLWGAVVALQSRVRELEVEKLSA